MPDREKWLFDCALGATHKTTAETNEEKPNTNWMSAELMMYCIWGSDRCSLYKKHNNNDNIQCAYGLYRRNNSTLDQHFTH